MIQLGSEDLILLMFENFDTVLIMATIAYFGNVIVALLKKIAEESSQTYPNYIYFFNISDT